MIECDGATGVIRAGADARVLLHAGVVASNDAKSRQVLGRKAALK